MKGVTTELTSQFSLSVAEKWNLSSDAQNVLLAASVGREEGFVTAVLKAGSARSQ